MENIRLTKSVKMLLEMFGSGKNALSAVYLADQLQEFMNKTTVYRILERLESKGIMHSFVCKDGLKWYAKCSSAFHDELHPHFQCTNCGRMECYPFEISIPESHKHRVEAVSLLLVGKCENCIS